MSRLIKKLTLSLMSWFLAVVMVAAIVIWGPGVLIFNSKIPVASAQTDTLTTSGTWTVPAGVSSAIFEAWGGGGAGGGSNTTNQPGSGGGGGGYSLASVSGLNVGDNYTVTVAGVTNGGTGNGSSGGFSQVTNPLSSVIVKANGGGGGQANFGLNGSGGSTTGAVGSTTYAGGNGGAALSGIPNTSGGGGGGAGSSGPGGLASGQVAGVGTSANGGNGGTGVSGKSAGNPGLNYGGGGSGGSKTNGPSQSGGAGAQGLVTVTYTVNSAPAAPTLITPASSATGISTTPSFTLRTTDADNDYLQYRIYLYASDCSTPIGTSPFAQAISQTGWSGQDANSGAAYVGSSTLTSSTIATYTYQGTLSASTTYCWKADAVDPAGTNTYGTASATQTFTTGAAAPTTDQLLRGGEYFSGGTKSPFYWAN